MNKEVEWKLFRNVFGHVFDSCVQESEAPDFLICFAGVKHGIEVAEVYSDSTDARLKYHDGYLASLLDGNGKIFKADKGQMIVDEIQIVNGEGEVFSTQVAVIRDVIGFDEAMLLVAGAVREKCKKIPAYFKSCDSVDLIISDSSGLFFIKNDEDFHRFFFHKFDRGFLSSILFREVFFVCSLWSRRRVVMPIKLNLFLSDYLAISVVVESELGEPWDNSEKHFDILLLAILAMGYADFAYDISSENLSIEIGASIVEFNESGISIKNHTSYFSAHGFTSKASDLRATASDEYLEVANRIAARRWENIAYVPINYPASGSDNEVLV